MIAKQGYRGQERFVCMDVCIHIFKIGEIMAYLMLIGMNLQKGKN